MRKSLIVIANLSQSSTLAGRSKIQRTTKTNQRACLPERTGDCNFIDITIKNNKGQLVIEMADGVTPQVHLSHRYCYRNNVQFSYTAAHQIKFNSSRFGKLLKERVIIFYVQSVYSYFCSHYRTLSNCQPPILVYYQA